MTFNSAVLEKMVLYKIVKGNRQGDGYTTMFNPTTIKDTAEVKFSDNRPMGSSGLVRDFYAAPPSKMNFEFVIDATGVMETPSESVKDVQTEVGKIREITQLYDGAIHEPPWVELVWGGVICRGRTTSLTVEYNLFKPSGKPLRAKVSLDIDRSVPRDEEKLLKNDSSPDLTHIVMVQAGDTLPLLCERIYNDANYYLDVAHYNNVNDFRRLVPGTELHFPPIK